MRILKSICLVLFGIFSMAGVSTAQLINLKTAPVATGDQFVVHPQVNPGLAGVSIAYDDRIGDAFVNPAMNGRLEGSYAFTLPSFIINL